MSLMLYSVRVSFVCRTTCNCSYSKGRLAHADDGVLHPSKTVLNRLVDNVVTAADTSDQSNGEDLQDGVSASSPAK